MPSLLSVRAASLCAGFLAFSVALSAPPPALAGIAPSGSVSGVTSAVAPPVTGSLADLDSPVWTNAFHATGFTSVATHSPEIEPTDAYLLFGPDALYCAFANAQPSSEIVATQHANGVGAGLDDADTLAIDTSGNGSNVYTFQTTPIGTRYQSASESTRYDPPWTALATISTGRWIAEMIVPYRFLRGAAGVWHVNFYRYRAAARLTASWAYETAMTTPADPTEWPRLEHPPALAKRTPPPTAQLYGLASLGRDRHVFEGAGGEFTAAQNRIAGVDVKLPITRGLDLVGTLDPDFSNLENDQQVVSPQEFAYQYAEYRPFFTQGATDLPGGEVFYSPSIGVFSRGEKLEGQVADFQVGALDVGTSGRDDRAYALAYNAPDREFSVGYSGGSARRPSGHDRVDEFMVYDLNLRSKVAYGAGSARETGTFAPNAAEAQRDYVFGSVTKPNYSFSAQYFDIGPEYHPLDAYVAVADLRGPSASGSLSSTTTPNSAVRNSGLSLYADRYLDRSGTVREADAIASGYVTFHDLFALTLTQNLSSLRSYPAAFPDYRGAVTTAYDQDSLSVSFRSGTPDSVAATYGFGRYANGELQQSSQTVTHQFGRRYSAQLDYSHVLERGVERDGQSLRRLSVSGTLSSDESLSAAYRVVDGRGGFASPGHNLAIGYTRRDGRGSTLQIELGSPAATRTLDRFVVKYVLLLGSSSGE